MPTIQPFPHLTSTQNPPPPTKVLGAYQSIFYSRVASGEVKPLVLPHLLYGIIPVTIYLCIDHRDRPWLYKARWVVLAGVLWWQFKMLTETGSRSPANGFAAGLVAAWGMVWATTWLVWERPQWDGKRVRRRKRTRGRSIREVQNGNITKDESKETNVAVNGSINGVNGQELKKRSVANGSTTSTQYLSNGHTKSHNSSTQPDEARNDIWEYYWEPYPEKVLDRLSWIFDLLITFRLPGWNYAIPPLPPLSRNFKTHDGDLLFPPSSEPKSSKSTRNILVPFRSRDELARYRVPRFIIGYVLLDIIKTTMMHDPYFIFGPTTYALPPHLAALHPRILNIYRQVLGGAGIIVAIELIFSLPPIASLLVPPSIDLPLTFTPPYHPSTWGSPSALLTQGLAGLWGTWWHQTFRFGFSAPYDWAIREGFIKHKTIASRIFALVCAFGISGFLHASGSYTETAHTKPLDAPKFFLSQILGIIIQTQTAYLLKDQFSKLPSWLRKTGNLLFIFAWLHLTGSWLIDDFSRCKIWLFEPILFSFTRGLGFGVEEPAGWKGFYLGKRWEPIDLRWHTGKHWWESGLAI